MIVLKIQHGMVVLSIGIPEIQTLHISGIIIACIALIAIVINAPIHKDP